MFKLFSRPSVLVLALALLALPVPTMHAQESIISGTDPQPKGYVDPALMLDTFMATV